MLLLSILSCQWSLLSRQSGQRSYRWHPQLTVNFPDTPLHCSQNSQWKEWRCSRGLHASRYQHHVTQSVGTACTAMNQRSTVTGRNNRQMLRRMGFIRGVVPLLLKWDLVRKARKKIMYRSSLFGLESQVSILVLTWKQYGYFKKIYRRLLI